VRSVEIAVDLAERHGVRVDAHCDEIDDEQSRFVEVLATRAARSGLRERVTASHTTAMGSYNPAYSYKLHRIIARSGIHMVSNPLVSLHLQGRFDDYPKRRGLTQVKELLAAGVNVAFGHDDVMDPWYPLGTANALQVAHVGTHAAQLLSRDEITETFRMVTTRAARVLGLDDSDYGVQVGAAASFVLLPAADGYDAVRRQVRPTHVVAHGRVVATTPPSVTTLTWPGEDPAEITFTPR
jgi:cytosine deaminase